MPLVSRAKFFASRDTALLFGCGRNIAKARAIFFSYKEKTMGKENFGEVV
jgi:hypothetical protein